MDSVAVPINDNTNPNRGAQQVHEIRHMDAIIGAARCARRAMQAHAHTVRAHKFLDERAAALAPGRRILRDYNTSKQVPKIPNVIARGEPLPRLERSLPACQGVVAAVPPSSRVRAGDRFHDAHGLAMVVQRLPSSVRFNRSVKIERPTFVAEERLYGTVIRVHNITAAPLTVRGVEIPARSARVLRIK